MLRLLAVPWSPLWLLCLIASACSLRRPLGEQQDRPQVPGGVPTTLRVFRPHEGGTRDLSTAIEGGANRKAGRH
jgi:hypothetical protein